MPDIFSMPVFILFLFCILSFGPSADAQTSDEARKELSATLSELKTSGERQKAIEQKRTHLEHELKKLQQDMVSLANDTVNEEEALSSSEEKLAILEEQKKDKASLLDARKAELSSMVSAMLKLQQLPPEAVIAMPGKLDETLATARALGVVAKTVEEEAKSLKLQLDELDALEEKIRKNQQIVATKKHSLETKQKQLAAKVKERTQLETVLGGKEQREKERTAQLTAKSQNIQDLLESLEKNERNNIWEKGNAPNAVKKHEKHDAKHSMRSFVSANGHIRMPAGKIISHYGNTSKGSAFSKGIMIEMREEARVVAPFDGEVVFAGPFRDYGYMVIIRYSNDYHTLLSGMAELNCAPGQFILEGEPIGVMGKKPSGNHLYFELRKEGKPVDPTGWFR